MITEVTVIQLEGEQPQLFQNLEREENEARAPFQTKRNNMVSALLAGHNLLQAVLESGDLSIVVSENSITITPPTQAPLHLEKVS